MTEHNYYVQQDKREAEFNSLIDERMGELDDLISDAYAILEVAQSTLFFKDDILSDTMTIKEFNSYIIAKLKEML